MRVLVTYGSKLGGTHEIAEWLAKDLEGAGLEAVVLAPAAVGSLELFDAVVVGGGLYAGRWPRSARRFVKEHLAELRARPVWLFSSGPLDDSAATHPIPPTPAVEKLMKLVGAQGHATFGGRLATDAQGFIASHMARKHAGDWRDPIAIRTFALGVAAALAGLTRPEPQAPLP